MAENTNLEGVFGSAVPSGKRTRVAVFKTAFFKLPGSVSGRFALASAITPVTCGAAIEVPLEVTYSSSPIAT